MEEEEEERRQRQRQRQEAGSRKRARRGGGAAAESAAAAAAAAAAAEKEHEEEQQEEAAAAGVATEHHTAELAGPGKGEGEVLGSSVGVRRLFHLSLFLTAYRMALPRDPSTKKSTTLLSWRGEAGGGGEGGSTAHRHATARSTSKPPWGGRGREAPSVLCLELAMRARGGGGRQRVGVEGGKPAEELACDGPS